MITRRRISEDYYKPTHVNETRTRISGDYYKPSTSSVGTVSRTRISGDYIRPGVACGITSSVCTPVTYIPVTTHHCWDDWTLSSSDVAFSVGLLFTAVAITAIGMALLSNLPTTTFSSLDRCHIERVCQEHFFGSSCWEEEVCTKV